jgi:ATP-dependent DNA helicase RecQ
VQNRHDQLSTFGIGDLDGNEWRGLFRQLIALGYLYADVDNYGALKMTAECKPLLGGSQALRLRQFVKQRRSRKNPTARTSVEIQAADTPLFDALRLHRSELAREQSVPPYVILHAEIPGIGAHKLELYGDELLRITRQHSESQARDESLETG